MTSSPQSLAAINLRGILSMLMAQAIFVASDTMIKLASAELPATQIMAVRGVIAIALMGGVVAASGAFAHWRMALRPLVLARAGIEGVLAILFVLALPHLALGDITTILQATPLILTALSAVILAEAVGWRRWLAVILGFVGVVLVVQPTGDGVNAYALIALFVAFLIAVRDLITRQLAHGTPATLVTFVTTVSVCLIGWVGSPLETWHSISPQSWMFLAGSGVLVCLGNFLMVRAFTGVEVSVVSPFRYVVVIWATVMGFAVWGDVPNLLTLSGMGLIVVSGLYTMHRETGRRRLVEATADTP